MSQLSCSPQENTRSDPVRRAVALFLLIYLSPVLLAVFLVGLCGMGLCAVARLVSRLRLGTTRGATGETPRPHLALAGQEVRSTRC